LLDEVKRVENDNRDTKLRIHLMLKKRGVDPMSMFASGLDKN